MGVCERPVRAHGAQLRRTRGRRGENRADAGGLGEMVTALDHQQLEEEDPSSGAVKGV